MRPHRTDGVSLTFGLAFLLIALWWAVGQVVSVNLPAPGWLVAGALIFFGVVGLMGAIRSGRRAETAAAIAAPADIPLETPGDLPPEVHADIVRELLEDPSERSDLQTAYPVPPQDRRE
ncbi:hypothetical protein [Winogradskya humida]|uniref:Uncharacterized protein n=1 Tax=Winogradskya humida TaxID=113566 RepID=A0ABQ3ZKE1_9ACTN|nr:hypothetical protein [Actinoplanes humidus]GIE19065.1 hypothetical protein Ahu01nite_021670 [Actinoplanes humidus]